MNFDIASRTIFLTLAGSRAYGMARPDSDYDYRGIAIAPLDTYIGVKDKFEQAISKELWKEYECVEPDADMQVFELTKFVRLALQCNPNVIEILFTDPEIHLIKHPIMEQLIDNKKLFLSKQAKARFCGYAVSQLNRIKRHKKWLDDPQDTPPNRADFGLPEKKLASLEQIGEVNSLIEKHISDFIVDQTDLPEHTKIDLQASMNKSMRLIWEALNQEDPFPIGEGRKFETIEDALNLLILKNEGFSDNFILILKAEKQYYNAKRNWDSYQNWKKNRNPERAALEEKFGMDCKHASHLVRLIRTCREILETGEVNVKRHDAEELKAIRNGSMTYEEIVEFAEKEDELLNDLVKKSSLPKVPNAEKIHQLTCEMVLKFNQDYVK